MKPVLIIQNDAKEGAGQLSTLIRERGLEQQTEFGPNATYNGLRSGDYSALVVLGGGQSAYETDKDPYLLDEIALCQDFIKAGKPIAGFCLGAQLLARAVGGEVVPGAQKEIGWHELRLSEDAANDALMQDHPKRLLGYHFHGDSIKSAPGCTKLASSDLTEWQLFRHGSNAYGFQYHAEVDPPLVEVMCQNNADYLAANGLDGDSILKASETNLPPYVAHCRAVLNRWLDLIAPQGQGRARES